jgi:uncharacterized SAM-binding protein YcdF (DUF218 family)
MDPLLFVLRKIAPQPFLPVGFALIFIALAILLRRRFLALIAFAVLLLASLPVVADALGQVLESRFPRIEAGQCPTADAIVVLGGIVTVSRGHLEIHEAFDRFETGVRLFQLGKAPVIIFTGAEVPFEDYNEGRVLRQLAIDHGVPPASVRVTGRVYHTESEAAAVREDLARHNQHRIILVTSAFHMPRAATLFHRAGVEFTPFPTDYRSARSSLRLERWVPTAAALVETDNTLHELYANLIYRVR